MLLSHNGTNVIIMLLAQLARSANYATATRDNLLIDAVR